MPEEENREIARLFFERVINKRDLDLARSILRRDFVDHNAPPGTLPGRTSM